jgi:O-6-methylguanine DNA methyltransferase
VKRLYLHSFTSRIGRLRIAATGTGLAIISLPGEPLHSFEERVKEHFPEHEVAHGGVVTREAERQIRAYLSGRLRRFRLPLDLHATPFQKKVLRRVQRIPYGSTMSYGEVAGAIGCPRAYRAVGTANSRNDLPLVIPCHRVVAKGGLGGYGGGLKLKERLLKMEGAL